jgi:hypothetical protein
MLRAAGLLALLAVSLAACTDGERPAPEAWRTSWQEVRALVPPAEAFAVQDPRPLCEEVLGELRAEESKLMPAPSPEVETRVQRWLELAKSFAYDCPPRDPPYAGFATARSELERLAEAVDTQLAYELGEAEPDAAQAGGGRR